MSDAMHYLIALGGLEVITLPFLIIGWRRAERDARKEIAKLTPPEGLALSDTGMEWLVDRLIERTRSCVAATGVLTPIVGWASLAFRDVPLVHEIGGQAFIFAMGAASLAGWTLATITSARASAGPRRSAPLTARTSRTYLRPWEYRLQAAHLLTAAASVAVVTILWFAGPIDGTQGPFYASLTVAWLLLLTIIGLLKRWTLRTLPAVDEDLHVARELMVSVAVRSLVRIQLLWVAVLGCVGTTYAYVTIDGFPSELNLAPLYVAGAIGLVAYIIRTNREDANTPAPEWYFARTLEPTS
ncbi:hypothetical protein MU582_05095 [Nocardioidaceae bacterium SCSIO 66511]|nr:hypothetical protein MU582_05095 [Nocardioidaceae bacterium SCSIO 66511]